MINVGDHSVKDHRKCRVNVLLNRKNTLLFEAYCFIHLCVPQHRTKISDNLSHKTCTEVSRPVRQIGVLNKDLIFDISYLRS